MRWTIQWKWGSLGPWARLMGAAASRRLFLFAVAPSSLFFFSAEVDSSNQEQQRQRQRIADNPTQVGSAQAPA